jgi:hypothetical protein
MSYNIDYVKAHPIVAGSSFVVGTGAGYGLTHHFLDFNSDFSLVAGVALGSGLVAAEAAVWKYGPDAASTGAKYGLFGLAGILYTHANAISTALAPVTAPIANAVDKAATAIGLNKDDAKFDPNTGYQISGTHQVDSEEERVAFAAWMMDPKNKAKQQAFMDAVADTHKPK